MQVVDKRAGVSCVATALDWPLARLERAVAALRQRLRSTGARLHPAGVNAYVIAPNRSALTTQQWIQLGQAQSGQVPFTKEAETELYHLIALHMGVEEYLSRDWR